ncbi:MAG: hypothetical protein Pg6C_03850 [Treponemataceae bacterium]|nr:MAG: hypothetical protein Pg6C_03850 [Treponemataceae bacterium]
MASTTSIIEENEETAAVENRQIRIFISSTFRDMMAERDYLVTKVFPALRRYCEERDVSVYELDLRWGISEEESKQGKVVDICLREIRKTTPFFIGLLGGRYGWVPSGTDQELIAANTAVFEEYPWVAGELNKGTSITEIEIQEGVLRARNRVNAYFYFRSPLMDVDAGFNEMPGSFEAAKLAALKETLRSRRDYPVKNYDSVEHLGTLVEADFKELVDRLFPRGALAPLEKERLEQRVFLKSRTGVYVPDPGRLEALDAFASGEERALVVSGGAGMGKSALLANWIASRKRAGETVIYHNIGTGRAEGDYRKITERLIREIRDIYSLEPDNEENAGAANAQNKQTEIVQNLLFAVSERGRLIIVLDGTDKLFDIDSAKLLNWLPAYPKNVKFIYAAAPEDATCDMLARRGHPSLAVEALPAEARKRLIAEYLKSFGKSLLPSRIERIARDAESGNPLALRTLLDELRVFGVHEKLDAEIDRYLSAESLEDFFALVLERLEQTYAAGETNLVKDVFCLIAASRSGLSEAEILELSGAAPLYWSQLYNAAPGHLEARAGLVTFSHQFIRDAARKRYFSEAGAEMPYRRRIAAAMEKTDLQNRKYDELPYQLCALGEWDRLYDFLLDFDVFEYINKKDRYELGTYWRALREAGGEKYVLEKYLSLEAGGRSKEELARLYNNIGSFVGDVLGDYARALEYQKKALEIREEALGKKHLDTANSYNNIGSIYGDLGHYAVALEYHQRALEIFEETLGKKHPNTATAYSGAGYDCQKLGDYARSLEYDKNALEIRENVLGKNHPDTAVSYNNIGVVYDHLGDYARALEYYKKALEIREKVLGKKHLDTAGSYNNIGFVFTNLGDYAKALEYQKYALKIFEEVLGKKHPDTASIYNNISLIYTKQGDYTRALEYDKKALEIREDVLGAKHLDTALSYNNIGSSYYHLGDYPKALEYLQQALETREEVLGAKHPSIAESYNNVGVCYGDIGDYAKNLEYQKKALEIREEVLGAKHPDTALSYNNIGSNYYHIGDYHKALEYYKKALEIFEEVLGAKHPDTVSTYNNIGDTYQSLGNSARKQGNNARAVEYYKKALEIREEILGTNHTNTAQLYENVAAGYEALGDYVGALEYYHKKLASLESRYGTKHIETAYTIICIAQSYRELKDYPHAETRYLEGLKIAEDSLGKNNAEVAQIYSATGGMYYEAGDFRKALSAHLEALEIRKAVLGENHDKTAYVHNKAAMDYKALGETGNALEHFGRALAIYESLGEKFASEAEALREQIKQATEVM